MDGTDGIRLVIAREMQLLDPATRGSAPELDVLLHPDFVEFGASGRWWSRHDAVTAMPSEPRQVDEPVTVPSEMTGVYVAENAVLLTYVRQRGTGRSQRSALWLRTETGWHVRFHQGTPIPPSD
jgi:hypothetical protein